MGPLGSATHPGAYPAKAHDSARGLGLNGRIACYDIKHSPKWEGTSILFGEPGEVFGRLQKLVGQLSLSGGICSMTSSAAFLKLFAAYGQHGFARSLLLGDN